MKSKVLAIFKYHRAWNIDIINRFSNFYATEHIYISDYSNKNFSDIIKNINEIISSKNIDIVIFDVDYFRFINFFFIEKIICKKKILVTGDDFELHEMHAITASACDVVLSHCPFSVLKFKEKGFEAYPISFEISNLNNDKEEKRDIDVLFFGNITSDRKEILDYISNQGISLKNVSHSKHELGLQKEDLLKLISKSKIVLNLSKSKTTSVQNYAGKKIYPYYYQFKGRVILAGLKGAACVSEYSPGQELIFDEVEVPTFYTKEECVEILKKLLKDKILLEQCTKRFVSKTNKLWDDKKNFEPIYKAIEKAENRKVTLNGFPYWYLRIVAKQIMLRNLKLSTIFKALAQFDLIFLLLKKANFLSKPAIFIETIINTFWYAFIFTFRSKK